MRWSGEKPGECNICKQPLTNGRFVDGRTVMGVWATMCIGCHSVVGMGLGRGKGQLYDALTLEKLKG
jgi:hypothetical protein